MRWLTKQHVSLFWIFLSTTSQICSLAAAQDGGAMSGAAVAAAAGNYYYEETQSSKTGGTTRDNNNVLTLKTKRYAPATIKRPGGGNNNNYNQGNAAALSDSSSRNAEQRNDRRGGGDGERGGSSADTFDGGGASGGDGEREGRRRVANNKIQRKYHNNKYDSSDEQTDSSDDEGEEDDGGDRDDNEEEQKFSQFAIGTLNHRTHFLRDNEGRQVEAEEEAAKRSATTAMTMTLSSSIGRGGHHQQVEEVRRKERPPPVMDPQTEDEIDDERIFYDIVDSKHLISRLGGGGGGSIGQQSGRTGLMGLAMMNHVGGGSNSASVVGPGGATAGGAAASTKAGKAAGNNMNTDGSCQLDDPHCSEMEAIQSLHKKLDDDANGNIDISESRDFLKEDLNYQSGFENRHRLFHFNDDMHISVRELWDAWRRSEVHNWTVDQTSEWLAQSVQLPQYVDLFKQHKVTGAYLPRLAVDNMQYLTSVLGIKDHIHKQKIALKAMDVVLFGPPRETGTRWKDYILVTLLLSVIVGCWYGYQQNKNSKTHLRRMAKDMEGLQKAEQALQEMQKELERARLEQENVATEKMDLERRLKENPTLTSSSSDLEVQQLKQEIEMLRRELSRAEIELVDHCWSPPQGLQTWLQLTYELETKSHQAKRRSAEKQLMAARDACEKLKKKRTSLVGAFVSTHGKSIDDVDRSIVEARNSLSEVTHDLQERMHRWKQIEQILGFNIVNNNGIAHLESILYSRNGSSLGKLSRGSRMSSSQDELDDDVSVQGRQDSLDRSFLEDSSASEENEIGGGAKFIVGGSVTPTTTSAPTTATIQPAILNQQSLQMFNSLPGKAPGNMSMAMFQSRLHSADSLSSLTSSVFDDRSIPVAQRSKKGTITPPIMGIAPPPPYQSVTGRTPMPPPRKSLPNSGTNAGRAPSTDGDHGSWSAASTGSPGVVSSTATTPGSLEELSNNSSKSVSSSNVVSSTGNKLVHQLSTTSTSTSSNESAPSANTKPTGGVVRGVELVSASEGKVVAETPPSTDSSVVDDEVKKRKRKLHFPFGKRSNKNKGSSVASGK